jgi:hypothetical protein
MDIKLFVVMMFAIVVGVVGIIQWIKGIWKDMPSLVSAIFLPVLSLALALAAVWAFKWPFALFLLLGGLAWAVAQLCYEIIVQSVPQVVQSLVAKAETVDAPGLHGVAGAETVATTPQMQAVVGMKAPGT